MSRSVCIRRLEGSVQVRKDENHDNERDERGKNGGRDFGEAVGAITGDQAGAGVDEDPVGGVVVAIDR